MVYPCLMKVQQNLNSYCLINMDTIWMVIAGIGITFILKYSYILRHPRNWVANLCETTKEFTNCCMCMGFWVGFFLKLSSLLITNGINTLQDVYICFLLGCIVSITSFFGDVFLEVMDAYIDSKKEL